MLGKRLASALLVCLICAANGQLRPGDRLTLKQYSEKLRQLTAFQNKATYQLQQGSALVMRQRGSTMAQAMQNLVPYYKFYIQQMSDINLAYARLNPPLEARRLNKAFVQGGAKMIGLTKKSLTPLEDGNEPALNKVRLDLRAFAVNFPKQIKRVIVESGFDYGIYEKKTELVLKKKKPQAH